jgi:hypothetical protein
VAVVPRPPHAGPSEGILAVPGLPDGVSSTAVRTGRTEWMAPEAAEFDARTGAWTDPARYERWLTAPHAG